MRRQASTNGATRHCRTHVVHAGLRFFGIGAGLGLAAATALASPAPTIITACPAVIAKPGLYEMNASVGASGSCITITAKNVTLGLNGYIVNNGAAGTGIRISKGATGAVVRGSGSAHHLENFSVGIEDQAGDAVIGDLTILNSTKVGLLLNGASTTATMLDDLYVQNVGNRSAGNGIHVTSPAGVRMDHVSVFMAGAYGILLDTGSSGSALLGITSGENQGTNIEIAGSGNLIDYCSEGYGQYGIVIEQGAGNNIVIGCSSSTFQPPSIKDAVDNNANCGSNAWFNDNFASTNQSCINNPAGGTAVSSCETISSSGRYYLTGDLASARGDCLDVTAANVGIYFADFNVSGARSGIGLHVFPAATGFLGLTGNGGSEITGFATGAEVDADGAIFEGIGADNNTDTGILVKNAQGVTLGANDGTSDGRFGYHLLGASRTLLHNSSALSNGSYGVFIEHSTGNLLDQFEDGYGGANGIAGIYLGSLSGPGAACKTRPSLANVIAHGDMSDNTKYGIVVDTGSDRNVLVNLQAKGDATFDAYDHNSNCAQNLWFYDAFTTSNNASCMSQP